MVSVGGNYYSVPDRTRRRVLEVHSLAREVRIYEDTRLLAVHPVLEGRRQSSILPGHRQSRSRTPRPALCATVHAVARRSLAIYDTVARHLAKQGRPG